MVTNNDPKQVESGVVAGWNGLPTATKVIIGALLGIAGITLLAFLLV